MNRKVKRILIAAGTAAAIGGTVYALRKGRRYSGIKLKKSIVIDRPASALYDFWRDLRNIPSLSDLLQEVEIFDPTRSRWTAVAPGGIPVQWDAEITKDFPDEMIGWCSTPDSPIETAGYVRFEPATGGRGTVVRVALEYDIPTGRLGAALATLAGKRPGAHVEELLRRFKQLMETGESAIA